MILTLSCGREAHAPLTARSGRAANGTMGWLWGGDHGVGMVGGPRGLITASSFIEAWQCGHRGPAHPDVTAALDCQEGLMAPWDGISLIARLLPGGGLPLGRVLDGALDHALGLAAGGTLGSAGRGAGGNLLVLVLFWCFHSTLQHTMSHHPHQMPRPSAVPRSGSVQQDEPQQPLSAAQFTCCSAALTSTP